MPDSEKGEGKKPADLLTEIGEVWKRGEEAARPYARLIKAAWATMVFVVVSAIFIATRVYAIDLKIENLDRTGGTGLQAHEAQQNRDARESIATMSSLTQSNKQVKESLDKLTERFDRYLERK